MLFSYQIFFSVINVETLTTASSYVARFLLQHMSQVLPFKNIFACCFSCSMIDSPLTQIEKREEDAHYCSLQANRKAHLCARGKCCQMFNMDNSLLLYHDMLLKLLILGTASIVEMKSNIL